MFVLEFVFVFVFELVLTLNWIRENLSFTLQSVLLPTPPYMCLCWCSYLYFYFYYHWIESERFGLHLAVSAAANSSIHVSWSLYNHLKERSKRLFQHLLLKMLLKCASTITSQTLKQASTKMSQKCVCNCQIGTIACMPMQRLSNSCSVLQTKAKDREGSSCPMLIRPGLRMRLFPICQFYLDVGQRKSTDSYLFLMLSWVR